MAFKNQLVYPFLHKGGGGGRERQNSNWEENNTTWTGTELEGMRTVYTLPTVHSYWSDSKGIKRQAKYVVWINDSKIPLKQEIFESVHSKIRGEKK